MNKHKTLRKDQSGLAAITITVFILVILSLVVLAFSQIARREQRQALDRQLSTQAFYAAESGINDVKKYIEDPANASDIDRTQCSETPNPLPGNGDLDITGTLKEVCVLFDRAPTTLEYSALSDRGELINLHTTSGPPLSSITIEWHDDGGSKPDGSNDFSGCTPIASILNFPKQSGAGGYADNCDASMLKVILMPVKAPISRESLVNDTYSAYLRPVNSAAPATISYAPHSSGADSQGTVSPVNCTSGTCKITINNISPSFQEVYMKITSPYKSSATIISGTNVAGNAVRFDKAQVKIDSTGKASDVLKRLQVRSSIGVPEDSTPPYALEVMGGICKRLDVYPGFADNSECGGIN